MPVSRFALAGALLLAGLLVGAPSGRADDDPANVVARWYRTVEAKRSADLLAMAAKDAQFLLGDRGTVQNLRSLIKQLDRAGSVSVRHRIEAVSGNSITALACYDVDGTKRLARETFLIVDGLIANGSQRRLGSACDGL